MIVKTQLQKGKITEVAVYYLLLAVAFSVVLPIRVNAIVSLVAFIFCFILFAFIGGLHGLFKTQLFILVAAQMAILLLGLTHSTDGNQGYADVERFGYALLFPTLIYLIRNSGLTVSKLIISFTAGILILTIYGLAHAALFLDSKEQQNVFEMGHVYFTNNLDISPMYLSIYIVFIFFFLLEMLRTKRSSLSNLKIAGLAIAALYLVIMLFFLRSQMTLLIFAILGVLYFIITLRKRAWLITFSLFTIGLIIFLLDKERVSTFFDTYGKNVSSALDNRFKVWHGAIEAVKERPILGGGTGSEHQVLNKAYVEIGYLEGAENSFNAHNQYLEYLVRNGPIELLAFFVLLIYSFKQSLNSKNYTFLLFNMLLSLSMLSESCLNLHKGIVFFYFFLSAFIYLPFDEHY